MLLGCGRCGLGGTGWSVFWALAMGAKSEQLVYYTITFGVACIACSLVWP